MAKTLLIISQTFVPDPAAVGQFMADVAMALSARGHNVRVYTQDRGYEDTSLRFARHEKLHGVDVRRFRFASFGKKSIVTRLIGSMSFMVQSFCVMLFTPNLEGIFFSTSPPMIGLIASLAAIVRRVPTAYWAMDLNPDQLIALGKLKPTDFTARLIEAINRFILRQSSLIITLDRYMAQSLKKRNVQDEKLFVLPLWPHEEHLGDASAEAVNPFRVRHNLAGKFVIMYSGNHSPSNPLDTLLKATLAFKDDDSIRFLFIGGGLGKPEIERYILSHGLKNVISLPYQPLADLKYSLPAADVHVVALGDPMVGIVHPCKIYGAMAVARPVLFLGPEPSHIADLLKDHDFGWRIIHGDVDGAIETIKTIKSRSPDQLARKGEVGREMLQSQLGQDRLQSMLCERLEQTFGAKS